MYKEKLPHAQTALILGIVSIVTACCCWGIVGIIIGAGIYRTAPDEPIGPATSAAIRSWTTRPPTTVRSTLASRQRSGIALRC